MVNGKQVGGALLSEEGTSGTTRASPGLPEKRGKTRASDKARKSPYSLSQQILQAFESCTARKGFSVVALKKHLAETGYNAHRHNSRLKRELNSLVSHGLLTRVSGTSGASGSFRFNRQGGKTGKSEPEKRKKAATTAQISPRVNREPPKAQRKQPQANKPKRQRKSAANPGKKSQRNSRFAGSNRDVQRKKGARRK